MQGLLIKRVAACSLCCTCSGVRGAAVTDARGGRQGRRAAFPRGRRGSDWERARVWDGSRGPVWGVIGNWAAEKGALSKLVLEGQALGQRCRIELSVIMEAFRIFDV